MASPSLMIISREMLFRYSTCLPPVSSNATRLMTETTKCAGMRRSTAESAPLCLSAGSDSYCVDPPADPTSTSQRVCSSSPHLHPSVFYGAYLIQGSRGTGAFPGIHSPERSPQYVRNPITGTEDNKLLMHSPHRAYANSTSCTSKLMQWKIQHERSTSWFSPDCNTTSREQSRRLQHDFWTHTKALGVHRMTAPDHSYFSAGDPNFFIPCTHSHLRL